MPLDRMLGFSLKPVRIDPDGASTPPDVSALAPPSHPAAAPPARFFEKTRIEGLTAPPVPAAPPAQGATPNPTPSAESAEAGAPSEPRHATSMGSRLRRLTPRASHALVILATFSAIIGFGSAVLWSRVLDGVSKPAGEARASAEESKLAWQAARAPSGTACARQREPRRVMADISAALALEAVTPRESVNVLLGAAASGSAGLGLSLNATTLEVTELTREGGARELLGVVPAADSGPPYLFTFDRAGVGGYRDVRTLPNQTTLALARTNAGIQLVRRGERRGIQLWPLHDAEEISRPRVEWLDAGRLAVALRRGGREGVVSLGWVDPPRARPSALRDVPFGPGEIGLPSLSVQNGRAVVVAAQRMTAAHTWRIQAATAEWHDSATRVQLPELAARPELDTFAPSITTLGDSRWLLQWTEGREGERRVRAITLDAAFRPIGVSITVSPQEASAGGGLVTRVDEGALSLFLVQKPGGYDLWATTLACH